MNKQNRLNANFKLWKDFTFEAAHQLTKVPVGHQCGRLHGHSYKIRVHCKGKLNLDRDWVVDYADIAASVKPLINKLDHTFLNDHFDFETTAENIAWWCANELNAKLPSLYAVELFETPTTSVIYELE
jgi:6-pyruvoyltetrahydropterin/6-carboxytetrahydropterin synthase